MASISAQRGARDFVMWPSTARMTRRAAASRGCCSSVSGSSRRSIPSLRLQSGDAGAAFGLRHCARPRSAGARGKRGATGCSFTKTLPWGAAAPLQGDNDSTSFGGWPRPRVPLLSQVREHEAEQARSTRTIRCPAAGKGQRPVPSLLLSCVTLYGMDSVMAPLPVRAEAWRRLARDLDPGRLQAMTSEMGLGEAVVVVGDLFAGKVRGRVVVDVNRQLAGGAGGGGQGDRRQSPSADGIGGAGLRIAGDARGSRRRSAIVSATRGGAGATGSASHRPAGRRGTAGAAGVRRGAVDRLRRRSAGGAWNRLGRDKPGASGAGGIAPDCVGYVGRR